jgi:TetR/AcrR family transcriptional repressor of nem operon
MGVSKQQAVENRKAFIGKARHLFRERGVEAVRFNEDLVAAGIMAAVEKAMASLDSAMDTAQGAGQDPLCGAIGWFLSGDHLQGLFEGCPLTMFVGDLPRLGYGVPRTYADGQDVNLRRYADIAATPGADPAESRRRTLTVYSHMIGGLLLSRAVAYIDTALADEIANASCQNLLERAA